MKWSLVVHNMVTISLVGHSSLLYIFLYEQLYTSMHGGVGVMAAISVRNDSDWCKQCCYSPDAILNEVYLGPKQMHQRWGVDQHLDTILFHQLIKFAFLVCNT